jgi:hypothetical protein
MCAPHYTYQLELHAQRHALPSPRPPLQVPPQPPMPCAKTMNLVYV